MIEFDEKDKKIVENMQNLLMKETADLDKITRSVIYNQIGRVLYKRLSALEGNMVSNSVAYYVPEQLTIYVVGDNDNIIEHKILHEMIHSVTDRITVDGNKLGFKTKNFYDAKKYNILFSLNDGINEAATEFYTINILKDEKYAYGRLVHIYDYLSEVCGYNELKKCFFGCDLGQFKDIVRKKFFLKNNHLIDKLLAQMDLLKTCGKTGKNKEQFMFVECCTTLLQLEYCRQKKLNPNLSNEEVFNKIDFNLFFDLKLVKTTEMTNILKTAKLMLYQQFQKDNNLEDSVNNYVDTKELTIKIVDNILNKKSLNEFSEQIKDNLPSILLQLNGNLKVKKHYDNIENSTIYDKFIETLKDKNGKIDFSYLSNIERNSAITTILYGLYTTKEYVPYSIFKQEDLTDYINQNQFNWLAFKDKNLAKRCLIPLLAGIDPKIKSTNNFTSAVYDLIFDPSDPNMADNVANFLKDDRVDEILK